MAAKEQTEKNEKPPGQKPSTAQKSGATTRWMYIMRRGAEAHTQEKRTNRERGWEQNSGRYQSRSINQTEVKKSDDEKPRKRGPEQVLSDKIIDPDSSVNYGKQQ